MQVIATMSSPFKEKFGIPRQSQLVKEAEGIIQLKSPFDHPDACRDLENYEYLWVIFQFHFISENEWSPLVRPPRLGGNTKVGVFASRSPFRPNRLGLSLVKLDRVEITNGKCQLRVSGVDLLDGTPIYDIKPYLPDLESIPSAKNSWRQHLDHEENFEIEFSNQAMQFIDSRTNGEKEAKLICAILRQDPRPGHKRGSASEDDKSYGMKLFSYDVQWKVDKTKIMVLQIVEDQLA